MSDYEFENNATTTLGSALGSADTTATVATGTGAGFPSPSGSGFFLATLWAAGSTTGVPNEIVKVTARTGDTMTIVRAQEGTTAQDWGVGATFANYPTAGFLNNLAQETDVQAQAGNWATDTGTANAGVVALAPVPANLAALVGVPIRVAKMGSPNTGAYTLNVNGFGAVPVTFGGNNLTTGLLLGSQWFTVVYDGSAFELVALTAYVPVNRAGDAMLGKLTLVAGASGHASLNLPAGTGPSAAVSGDIWSDGSRIFFEVGSNTNTIADANGVQVQSYVGGVDSGSANAYNVAQSPAISGPQDRQQILLQPVHTNTGASTLAVNGGAAKSIKKCSAGSYADLAAGDLTASHFYWVVYNNGADVWQLMTTPG